MNSASTRSILKLVSFLLFATASMSSLAEQGVVLDKTTGKPIPGAIVVATWNGVVGVVVQGTSQCYKVEVAIADDKGRFNVSSFSWNLNPFMIDRLRGVTVLAPGYGFSADWDPTSLRIPMEPRTGTKSEQFKHLPSTQAVGCFDAERVMLPYLKALSREMASLATTKEDKLKASSVLFLIERIEVGADEARRRLGPREGEIKRGPE
jgi:hypothetical protein